MGFFEETESKAREYIVILDSNGNTLGIFNPTNKRIPLTLFVEAFNAKGINAEIRTQAEVPVQIVL